MACARGDGFSCSFFLVFFLFHNCFFAFVCGRLACVIVLVMKTLKSTVHCSGTKKLVTTHTWDLLAHLDRMDLGVLPYDWNTEIKGVFS